MKTEQEIRDELKRHELHYGYRDSRDKAECELHKAFLKWVLGEDEN